MTGGRVVALVVGAPQVQAYVPAPQETLEARCARGALEHEVSTAELARAAGLDPRWLTNATARVRAHHPQLSRDQLVTEALARRWWHDTHPGRQVANGRTTVEHLAALAVQVEGRYSPEAWQRERAHRAGHRTPGKRYAGSAVPGLDWRQAFDAAARRRWGSSAHPWERDNAAAFGTGHRQGGLYGGSPGR